jgi:hypothetical protein
MTLQTYWLVVAPGVLFGLSLIGWAALFMVPRVPAHPGGGKGPSADRTAPMDPEEVKRQIAESRRPPELDFRE